VSKKAKKKSYKKVMCKKCTGLCCRYFALPIEDPEDWDDYDDIRWYLCHDDISVFLEDGDWYLNVENKCKYLADKDHTCKHYDKRPKICRGYETEDCDFTGNNYDHELYFTTDKQMEEYMKIKFGDKVFDKLKPKKKRKRRKKKK
jgi:Fe-S-cluster containining protein